MSTISATLNPSICNASKKPFWQLAKGYAGIIDSRESTYRTYLDLTGYCFPMTFAAAFRNIYNFAETLFETAYDAAAIFVAPHLTKFSGSVASKFSLDKKDQKDYLNY